MKPHYTFILLASLLLGILAPANKGLAQEKSKKVQALENERNSLLKSIEKTGKQITEIKGNVTKKRQEAQLLKKQVNERTRLVKILDQEILILNNNIDSLQRQIVHLQQKETESKAAYARSTLAIQRSKSQTDQLLFVLSSKDFDQALRRMRYVSQYAKAHQQAAEQLRDTQTKLQKTQNNILVNKKEKSSLLAVREKERTLLKKQEVETNKEVSNLSSQQKKLERKQQKQKQRAKQLDEQIRKQVAFEIAEAERKAREEQERLEREARAQGKPIPRQSERRAEIKGGYAMNESERTLAKTFAANKGKLPPPVNAPYVVSSSFGVQQHNSLSRVQTNNGGIDLTVPQGTSAVAIFNGKVSNVFVLPGYNTSIIIRHGNYLTVYANLINVTVKTGQEVKTGQRLGTVAQDAETGKYTLQFQVWHERQKVNPQSWIR